jgi:ankyrin repeat protein
MLKEGTVDPICRHPLTGRTPLHVACAAGQTAIVNVLLPYVLSSSPAMAQRMVDNPLASISSISSSPPRPLASALEITDDEGWRALEVAVRYGREDIVEKLLIAGTKIDREGEYCFPLKLAVDLNHFPIVDLLLRYLAPVGTSSKPSPTSPRSPASSSSSSSSSTWASGKLPSSANSPPSNQQSALAYDDTDEILDGSAGVGLIGEANVSSGSNVVRGNDAYILGVGGNNGAGGYSPVHIAAENGNLALLRVLVQAGFPVNAVSDDGYVNMIHEVSIMMQFC